MKHLILFSFLVVYTLAYSQTKYDLQITFEGRERELIVSVPTKQPPQGGYPVVFIYPEIGMYNTVSKKYE